jgi:hypothetical protein
MAIQLVCPPFAESTLFAAASWCERIVHHTFSREP